MTYLTVRQAAGALCVHYRTILNYLRNGVLTSVRVTPRSPHRIPAEQVERLSGGK